MAAAAYSAYHDSDTIYSMHQYYPTGTCASPVEHDYSAGEASYMLDTSRAHWPAQPSSSVFYPASTSASDYASPASQQVSYPSPYTASSLHTTLQDPYAASTTPLPRLHRVSCPAGNAPANAPYTEVKTKEEELESGFVFELMSHTRLSRSTNPLLDSIPELPLRATQASKEMRVLMGAFRLDPFAMHNGVNSAASQSVPVGIEIGPLRVPPVMFEWQAELVRPLVPQSARWFPEEQPMHAFDDEKLAHAGAMEVYGEVSDGRDDMDADVALQPVMTPEQAANCGTSFADQQGMVSASSSSPEGYPVQPLSGILNRSGHSSSSQASIGSRSLPSLPKPRSSLFYRQTQNYALWSPTATLPSPSALHLPSLSQSPIASSAMRTGIFSVSTSLPSLSRRCQLDFSQMHSSSVAQPQPQYASPSPPAFLSNSNDGGGGVASRPGCYSDGTQRWYGRSAFALEAYTASACT
ncbi:uncharacterized protein B0H18DRAFT_959041 [Fomitopsis serialis]|uniref:uncharacterized protein n=1 Tax=Fomitopsis serialis TaxID=139415 RepID=UPI002008C39D|nr:uncharacterized protein B0H18DRAFT_959041 [Neoantrodia serialis]KAH9915984.1 hypothetical protein B0H18DRAFT_959041 [Neoantrodia serialis]